MSRFTPLFAAAALAPAALFAQRYTSPPAQTSLTIGSTHIKVEYYAPSAHGRKIMGGLVPYGEVWCTGANWATKITTDSDLDINGLKVPKGSYSLWTVPNEKEWTLIVNRQTGQFHLDYDQRRDFGRVKMNLSKPPSMVETFKIQLSAQGSEKGQLSLLWENTDASVPFTILR